MNGLLDRWYDVRRAVCIDSSPVEMALKVRKGIVHGHLTNEFRGRRGRGRGAVAFGKAVVTGWSTSGGVDPADAAVHEHVACALVVLGVLAVAGDVVSIRRIDSRNTVARRHTCVEIGDKPATLALVSDELDVSCKGASIVIVKVVRLAWLPSHTVVVRVRVAGVRRTTKLGDSVDGQIGHAYSRGAVHHHVGRETHVAFTTNSSSTNIIACPRP
mmetsp:Transcript_51553/g.118424  ORF Transcript_51553/g.118424 Transcript_51553/m.118424 type:complete len:215 (+) Transcript_51553:251-895(+)